MTHNLLPKIDFVITWVDGADADWLKQKEQFSPISLGYGSKENRFRDWDNLHFWFRGVEAFSPWVNRIFFITWGHLPSWLNVNHPKLRIIKHSDYIPSKYLPTFNSNTIELNIGNIEDLSENFVLFNDDTFLIQNVDESVFFADNCIKDMMSFDIIQPGGNKYGISYINLNNLNIINEKYSKKALIKKNFSKIYNIKYGADVIRSILLSPWRVIPGFKNPHLPQPHFKSTFNYLWENYYEVLDRTCSNRFRGIEDVNHWLARYINICEGRFIPRSKAYGKYFNVGHENSELIRYISRQQGKMVCINDMDDTVNLNLVKNDINCALDAILPHKSSFEL